MADIYSFGIIAHEIIVQRGVFYLRYTDMMKYHQLADDVPVPQVLTDRNQLAEFVINVMNHRNHPTIRPTFPQISDFDDLACMNVLRDLVRIQFMYSVRIQYN